MKLEWLILADSAQVIGNKLYLLGGGWDRLTINRSFPAQHPMAVALSFRVPWNETNKKHSFEIEILTGDGKEIAKIGGQIEVGRPPGIPPGQDQRTQTALTVGLPIENPGTYEVIARVEGKVEETTIFNVIAGRRQN